MGDGCACRRVVGEVMAGAREVENSLIFTHTLLASCQGGGSNCGEVVGKVATGPVYVLFILFFLVLSPSSSPSPSSSSSLSPLLSLFLPSSLPYSIVGSDVCCLCVFALVLYFVDHDADDGCG